MIARIIDFSVKHRVMVLAVIAIGCVAGWRALQTVPVDATPDLSDTQVSLLAERIDADEILNRLVASVPRPKES